MQIEQLQRPRAGLEIDIGLEAHVDRSGSCQRWVFFIRTSSSGPRQQPAYRAGEAGLRQMPSA